VTLLYIVIAKACPHVLNPVLFALHLGIHFATTYPHIHRSEISLEKLKWSRIILPGTKGDPEGHNHSFVRDGEEKETVKVWVDATKGKETLSAGITAGVKDLLRECRDPVDRHSFECQSFVLSASSYFP
jgi:urate oxidase